MSHKLMIFICLCIAFGPLFWAATPSQAAVQKLNGTLIADGDVDDFQLSPNNQFVVYKADQRVDHNLELYSVPLTGGTPTRLNREPIAGISRGITSFGITSDSARVVYTTPISGELASTLNGLYSVPITGPAGGTALHLATAVSENVWDFKISPDGKYVVYRAGPNANNLQIYSIPVDGSSGPVGLNKPLVSGGGVTNFYRVSPNSARLVYVGDQDTDETFELYSVPITGTANSGVKLNPTLPANGDVGDPAWVWASQKFLISPNSQSVVYLAVQDATGTALFSVPIGGTSGNIKLSQPVTNVPGWANFTDFEITPDSANVVFSADQENSARSNVYRVPISGPASSAVRLNNPAINSNTVNGFAITNNGTRLVYYVSNGGPPYTHNIYSVPTLGTDAQVVNIANDSYSFQLTSSGSYVVYRQNEATLLSVPVDGPANTAITLTTNVTDSGGGSYGYQISPTNNRVIYLAGTNGSPTLLELYSTPITLSDTVKINGPMVSGGEVPYYGRRVFTSDGGWVVYIAAQDTAFKYELYATNTGAPQFNQRLYLPLVRR